MVYIKYMWLFYIIHNIRQFIENANFFKGCCITIIREKQMKKVNNLIFISAVVLVSLINIGLAQAGYVWIKVEYQDSCPRSNADVWITEPEMLAFGTTNESGLTDRYNFLDPNTVFHVEAYYPWPTQFGPIVLLETDQYGNGYTTVTNNSILDSDGNGVGDCHQPQWRNQGQSSNSIGNLESNYLYAQVKSYIVDYAWLATNETGSWQNKTYIDMNDPTDWTWSNFSWSNSSFIGILNWKIYFNDTSGFTNITNEMSFEVYDSEPPKYSNIKPQSHDTFSPGKLYQFNITWTDNIRVSTVIIEHNFTGSFANHTVDTHNGNEYYYNYDLPIGNYQYKWYANDTRNNWNSTDLLNFTVVECLLDNDCNRFNLSKIATCDWIPDGYHPTWDFRSLFTSQCIADQCTRGDETITHTCDVSSCSAECDQTHLCIDKCGGSTRYYSGSCDLVSSCTCSYSTEDCNTKDSWYDIGSTKWVSYGQCAEKEQKERKYKDYTCSAAACTYTVTSTQWIYTGNIRNKPDGTSCDDGNGSTGNDVCKNGSCVGTPYKYCYGKICWPIICLGKYCIL
jgi:hypothetical protein